MALQDNDYEEDLDNIDFNNYKGMFYNDQPGTKYQDPVTGAHFEFRDMCNRLKGIFMQRQRQEKLLPPEAVRENKQGFKQIQAILKGVPPVDSRNTGHTLPQQGYGTVLPRNNAKASVIKNSSNVKLFATHMGHDPTKIAKKEKGDVQKSLLNIRKELDKEPMPAVVHESFRSKSLDKRQANSLVIREERQDIHKTYFKLLVYFFTLYRAKNVAHLLERPAINRNHKRTATDHRYRFSWPNRQKILHPLNQQEAESARTRNWMDNLPERRTYVAEIEKLLGSNVPIDSRRKNIVSQNRAGVHYQIAANLQQKIKDAYLKGEPNERKRPATKLHYLKSSLAGLEAVSIHSRNAPEKAVVKRRQASGVEQRKLAKYPVTGIKRGYFSSLLQPSLSMKKWLI